MGIEEIIDNPSFRAGVDGLIVFIIALVTELLVIPGFPTGVEFYHASLVAILAGVVFYAKNKGIEYKTNKKRPSY